jgi:uncharacterized membrane protein YeaQ/YmgE (transglycosylase-associated protein family)
LQPRLAFGCRPSNGDADRRLGPKDQVLWADLAISRAGAAAKCGNIYAQCIGATVNGWPGPGRQLSVATDRFAPPSVLAAAEGNCVLRGQGTMAIRPRLRGVSKKEFTMGLIILIIVGGILGWLASMVMRTDGQQGIFLNVVVGIVGALLAGFILNPLIGGGNIMHGDLSMSSLLVSFLGAVVLLAIVNLVRRGSVR